VRLALTVGEERRRAPVRYSAVLIGLATLAIASSAVDAHAQNDADQPRGRFFVGGSLLAWSAIHTPEDPPGGGYLQTYFHGALNWPAIGANFQAAVFVAPRWSVGGEVAIRSTQSTAIRESFRTKFEGRELSSSYAEREHLISFVARRHAATTSSKIDLQPLAGVTFSRNAQALTNRSGFDYWIGGERPVQVADAVSSTIEFGLVGGADVTIRGSPGAGLVFGARVHWISRPDYRTRDRVGLTVAPVILHLAAGVRWTRRS